MIPYGRYGNGTFWIDANGFITYVPDYKTYVPDKPWNWDLRPWNWDLSYKHQDKDKLRKKLYGNMTGQTTKHEYSRLNFTKRLRKKLLKRQMKKQTN